MNKQNNIKEYFIDLLGDETEQAMPMPCSPCLFHSNHAIFSSLYILRDCVALLRVAMGCLKFVIVLSPDHTHLLISQY